MEKNVTVAWAGKLTFIGKGGTGESITMDAGTDDSLNLGHSPMDLLLIAAGGCASIDVVMILKKGRYEVTDCVCHVSGDRTKESPRRYTDIHLHFEITGKNLKDAAIERAVNLSMEKYCSVSATLSRATNLTYDWEVVDAA